MHVAIIKHKKPLFLLLSRKIEDLETITPLTSQFRCIVYWLVVSSLLNNMNDNGDHTSIGNSPSS